MSLLASHPAGLSHVEAAAPRVLVVDDEQHMCEVCSRTLRRSGYEVVTTSDPHAAIALLRDEPRFDLLLTDIKMPAMSGLDLAHIARQHDPSIAIIVMTGFASMENMQQSVQRGIADFLSKPFELDQLRMAVDQALQKRALMLDNLRLHTLERLLRSSEALSATLELTELANILLREALQQSGWSAGFVLLAEAHPDLELVAATPPGSMLLDAGLVLSQQALRDQHALAGDGQPFCRSDGRELQHALAVVLRAQGQANGVLLLCDETSSELRPGVQEEVAVLANQAGAALRNAHLYRQLGEAYQRLQEFDRLKSEFISIASHELRTPLSIVLGYTTMLRDQSSDQQREYLQRVMEGAQRIKDIVDDMVSLRHLETGETHLVLESCDLRELVHLAIARLEHATLDRQHTIDVLLPDQQLMLLCDREKVLLVLNHLISNAIKFTPKGGRIAVRVTLCSFEALARSAKRAVWPDKMAGAEVRLPWVAVEVEDSGVGIPEGEQLRIFERFYQVASSLTRDHGGIGLGLAIVRELIDALGGAVWVTSIERQGSTFGFALPCRQEQIAVAS